MLALWNTIITLLWRLLYFYPPFRGTVGARLGRFNLGVYDPLSPGLKVLVNAVSAGEVVAIAPFIRELKHRRPDCQVVLLTTTESGQTMAREKLADCLGLLAYFPLIDVPWVVRRYLDLLRPDLYITTESELWPNIMAACRRRGIPVALVNARLYLHNKTGLRRLVVRRLYDLVDLIVCQDDRHYANFVTFGLPIGRLAVSGNTKFDFELPEWNTAELERAQAYYGLDNRPVLTAGSTHPGEEVLLLDAQARAREDGLPVRLILAPRHVERADEAAGLAAARGLRAIKLADYQPGADWDVIVVDRYGVLTDMYRLADVVVMGGTFHPKVGGHNILEATVLAKPVVVGPYTYSITAQLEMLSAVAGIVTVPDAAGLPEAVSALLADAPRRQAVGDSARRATLANRGASRRAVELVLGLVTPSAEGSGHHQSTGCR